MLEEILDLHVEDQGHFERQRQRGVVAAPFDGDDGLSRDADLLAEHLLTPAAGGAQLADAVIHGRNAR